MTLKRWVLGKVNQTVDPRAHRNARVAPTLQGDADTHGDASVPGKRELGRRRETLRDAAHLGRYAPLVSAIREELGQFVTDEVRLHLAIAERDRFVLTSIEVECEESEEHRDLLRRFLREFKPEQIKQYLARDVIAGLRNASAIDLTQFAGLNATQEAEQIADEEDDPYTELVAQLQSQTPEPTTRVFEVRLIGRWAEQSEVTQRANQARANATRPEIPHTPLAARSCTLRISDAAGARSIDLSLVPGRRYSIGKDTGCDIAVDGVYVSRRHCEIWLDHDRWSVADAGSTNGIRVEAHGAIQRRAASTSSGTMPIETDGGVCVVLSAHGDGDAAQYPRIELPAMADSRRDAPRTEPATLVTPIAPARRLRSPWSITAQMASGTSDADIAEHALPFSIGRSRNQGLVIDWAHTDVSGRHVDIVGFDASGALVLVHGDNGVSIGDTSYPVGAQFCWKAGEEMLLGRMDAQAPRCRLLLSHVSE